MKHIEIAAKTRLQLAGDDWFDKMSPDQQKEYVTEHPASKFAKSAKKSIKTVQNVGKKAVVSVKDFSKDQKTFFRGKDHEAKSEARRSFSTFIKDKAKGLVKGLKHEVKEFKMAGVGLAKLASGHKLDHHEKGAIKAVLLHSALVIGPMAMTGGLSAGLSHVLPAIATHFLEHSMVMTAGKAALFASAKKDDSDALMQHLITKFAEYIETEDFDQDTWKEMFEQCKPSED